MNWDIEYDKGLKAIVLNFNGECASEEFYKTTEAHINLYKETGSTKILIDGRKLEVYGPSSNELYVVVTKMYEDLGDKDSWEIAIVSPISPGGREAEHFYKSLCFARGWNVESFPDREKAIDWLCNRS